MWPECKEPVNLRSDVAAAAAKGKASSQLAKQARRGCWVKLDTVSLFLSKEFADVAEECCTVLQGFVFLIYTFLSQVKKKL
jgi:hypothetical protein